MKWIIVVAVMVRMAAQFMPGASHLSGGDPSEYISLAHNIAKHHAFSFGQPHRWGEDPSISAPGPFLATAARPPLYPAFIALFWWGEQPPYWPVRIAQVLLGTGTVAFVFLIALRTFGRRIATIAGWMLALGPANCELTGHFMSETLYIFLITASLWALASDRRIAAGILLGLSALTRAPAFPFILIIGAIALLSRQRRKKYGVAAVFAILVVAPWLVRNVFATGRFVAICAQGWGSNLYFATIDVPYGSGNPWPLFTSDPETVRIVKSTPDETAAERELARAAWARISAHPFRWAVARVKTYPRFFLDSGAYLLGIFPDRRVMIAVKFAFLCGSFLFVLLAGWGIMLSYEKSAIERLVLFPAYIALAQFPMLEDPRYFAPLAPCLAVFAAVGLVSFIGLVRAFMPAVQR